MDVLHYILSLIKTMGLYGAGSLIVSILMLFSLPLMRRFIFAWGANSRYDSKSCNEYVVTFVLFLVTVVCFFILLSAVSSNPYEHLLMTGDAAVHVQWSTSYWDGEPLKISSFAWESPPKNKLHDPVFGVATAEASSHVGVYYGYFFISALGALFYKIYPYVGHHVVFVAFMFYIGSFFSFAYIFRHVAFGSLEKFAFYVLWCLNPLTVSAIIDGGRYEVALWPIYFACLYALIFTNRHQVVFLLCVLLAGSSRSFSIVIAVYGLFLVFFRAHRTNATIAIFTAAFFLAISQALFFWVVNGIGGKASVVSGTPVFNDKIFDAALFNFGLVIFVVLYFQVPWLIFSSQRDKKVNVLCVIISTFLLVGFAILSLRSYSYSFHRNVLIIGPVLLLAFLFIERISEASRKLWGVASLIAILVNFASSKADGYLYIKNSLTDSSLFVRKIQIEECITFLDAHAKGFQKVGIVVPRSLEAAFIHKYNYWFMNYAPSNIDAYAVVTYHGDRPLNVNSPLEWRLPLRNTLSKVMFSNEVCSVDFITLK
jgi:hypothetical protein